MKNDPSTVNITENLVTCSQYIEVKQEIHIKTELNRQSQSDDNFSDDTLNEIFKQADEHLVDKVHNQSPVEVLNKKSQNISRFPETQAISEPVTIKTEIETERTSRTKDSKNLLKSLMNSELQNKCKLEEEATFKRIVSARPKLAPVITSIFREQGPFFGLTNKVRQLILKTKGIKELYDWQEECLNLRSIFERRNLIYALPTSGGKTLVAEILMLREILLRGLNVIFVLPYVSIVQEKIHDLMPFAMELGFLLEEYCAGKGSIPPVRRRKKNSIFICTIEKSQIMFDSLYENGRLNEIGLIVVDELHMIGDAQRGYNLETLLAKAVMQQEHRIQVVGMSATIANLNEVASFLEADVYTRDFRPVELKEYVKFGSDILSVNSKASSIADAFKVERSNIGDNYPPKLRQRDPDHLTALVLEVVPSSSCLIFCATKLNCEHVAILLSQTLPKELTNYLREQKKTIVECIRADGNGRICGTLLKTLPYGVAYHHSGLTNDERKHLEEGFRQNIISVICCTSTLAAGVNLPASRVIIRSPYIGPHFLTLSRYKQMIGRAGRAGKAESGESVMICEPKDHSKLTGLLCSKMDETISGFVQDQSGALFRTVVMNCVGNKFATTFGDLMLFFNRTLLKVQIDRMEKSLRQILLTSIEELLDEGALSLVPKSDGRRNLPLTIKLSCGEEKTFYSDDHLEVSKLGKAAVNAGLSLEEAKKLEKELKKAQINFVLTQYVHLMYIVTPDDIVNSCSPHYQNYNTIFMKLDQSVMHTASIIGMTEKTAMKLVMNPRFKEEEKYILDRFYITLMLYDLWNGMDIYDVGVKYKVNRGIVNKLMMSAATRAYCILKFCEVYDDFWAFKDLLEHFSKRLAYCCSNELMPLLELPAVRIVAYAITFIFN